jgi:hypothetical protein
MGHFLATVNPEAAEAIGAEVVPLDLPGIGTTVQYFPRPGEGRGGRSEFSFIVTQHTPDGRVGGVGVFDAQDFRDVMPCWRKSDDNPFPAWDWPKGRQTGGSVTRDDLDAVREAIRVVGARVTEALVELRQRAGTQPDVNDLLDGITGEQIADIQGALGATERRLDAMETRLRDLEGIIGGFRMLRERVHKVEGELGLHAAPLPSPPPYSAPFTTSASPQKAVSLPGQACSGAPPEQAPKATAKKPLLHRHKRKANPATMAR